VRAFEINIVVTVETISLLVEAFLMKLCCGKLDSHEPMEVVTSSKLYACSRSEGSIFKQRDTNDLKSLDQCFGCTNS
jgi:hypothetical protein